MAPSKLKLRVKKRDGGKKSSKRLVANASPDSKCPICLDGFNNVASLDLCLHQFCFRCIHEWSKNKAECPLCKQPFHSIFHSVKGENDFKEFVLPQVENGAPPNVASATPTERVLRPRALRDRERRSHRLRPSVPSSPLDNDVMFNGLSDVAGLAVNHDVQQMVLRLTARRRGRGERRSLRHLRDQDVVAFRRALYRTGVRVRNTREAGRQRDVSPAFLRQNPACLRRLLPWLQRELTVLYGSHGSLVNIVQHVVMSRITNYNMEEPAIRDELRPFLLARTDHFLHELVNFACSTLSMEAYDQQAIYDCPAPSYEEGSDSDSSVIAISEDEGGHDSEENQQNPSVGQENIPLVPTATSTQSLLSEAVWDDETPGPSYSTLPPSPSQSQEEGAEPPPEPPAALDAGDEEEGECLIVGYVKPMAERTPELVQLSSDSSEEEEAAAVSVTNTDGIQTHSEAFSSSGPKPSCSPKHTPLDTAVPQSRRRKRATRSRTSSSQAHHMEGSQHSTGSQSHLRSGCEHSGFSGHKRDTKKRHKSHLHNYSATQEHAGTREPSQPGKRQDGLCMRSAVSWSEQSSTMSLWSDSDRSPSSSNKSQERSHHGREQHSHLSSCWKRERGRRRKNRRSCSPNGSHHFSSQSHESQRSRKHHRRSFSSSSSADSHRRRSLDKPRGKCKYKTRHLEQAGQHQQGGRSVARDKHKERQRSSGKRVLSRSPSVEIIYEREAPDLHRHKRKKRRKREQRSPTVITIDSDSDLPIDCLDRVLHVTDKTTADISDQRVGIQLNPVNTSALLASDSRDPTTVPPERMLNLDDCTVNVVDHSRFDSVDCTQNIKTNSLGAGYHTGAVLGPLLPMTTTPPSDTRLLASILQDLEKFLPGVEQEAEENAKSPLSPGQQRDTTSPQRDRSSISLENRHTDGDGEIC